MSARAKTKSAAAAETASATGKAGPSKARKHAAAPKVAEKAPAAKAENAAAEQPKERVKLVRDSFTMPREDFDLIDRIKARAIEFKRPAKKSELLRAGLQVLATLQDTQLRAALDALRPLKAGRPKNRR
jgi:hypothetical protein